MSNQYLEKLKTAIKGETFVYIEAANLKRIDFRNELLKVEIKKQKIPRERDSAVYHR